MHKTGAALIAIVSLLGMTGCATSPLEREEAADRGRALAARACGQCHGVDAEPSAWRDAPAFRDMQFEVNRFTYERRVAQLTHGHVGMPPTQLSDDDLRDLAAYVRRLNHPRP
jgi:mono/diheme cytochrome c family protein